MGTGFPWQVLPGFRAIMEGLGAIFSAGILSLRQFSSRQPNARGLKSPEDGIATTRHVDIGSSQPLSEPRRYHDLAKGIRQSLPQTVTWLSSADLQIIDGANLSAGGNSDVFGGLYQGRSVAVKSPRRYSSPEFDPAEGGIVRLRLSARLV